MNSEKQKIMRIPSPDGSKMIEVTLEELKEYTKCMDSQKLANQVLSVAGGLISTLAVQFKPTPRLHYYLKKGVVGLVGMSFFSVITTLRSALSCGHVLQKILKDKMNNPPGRFEDPVDERDETSTKELLDFTPSISYHDFSGPINFSSDTSGGDSYFDKLEDSQDLGGKTAAGKKRVTYDDLWRLHKQNSQTGNKLSHGSEGTDIESPKENEPSWEKKKIRTNKYGDPLE